MSTPMSVDSASVSMPTPMLVDSEVMNPMEPTAESVFDMIDIVVRDHMPRVSYNKNQCKRIADRFNTIGEKMKSMALHEDSGPVFPELIKILKRGQMLVQGYAESPKSPKINSLVVSRVCNRDAFKEFHKDLHLEWAKLGVQSLPEVDDLDLQHDAEKDEMAMLEINQNISQSSSDHDLKKRAQVVSEKTKNLDEFGDELPSYLAIDRKSDIDIEEKRLVREYEVMSERDPKHEFGWTIVHPGKWLGCDFAIKVFKCSADHGGAAKWNKEELFKEARSLVALQHPHVVRLVGFGEDEKSCLFVMELMDGDLKHSMKNGLFENGLFEKRDVINQIAKGMYFVHERGYAHGDLKCTNILVKKLDDRVLQVKIGDLRGSQKLGNWDPKAFERASKIRRPRWTAPEAIDNYGGEKPTEEQLKQSDVYSFGMTCYEIVKGKLPFDGIFEKDGLLEYIQEGRVEDWNELPEELDEDLKGIIRTCWEKEPSKRPTFEEICLILKSADRESGCAPVRLLLRLWRSLFSRPASEQVMLPSGTPPHVAIIPSAHLTISKSLMGVGRAGSVFKATWLNCTVAVKILRGHPISPEADGSSNAQAMDSSFIREVDYLIKVSHHPYTVQLIGLCASSSGDHWSIVMEHMDTNLQKLIEAQMKANKREKSSPKRSPFNFDKGLLIITKIALGMVYLHSRGLVHRDLNPNNVLVRDYAETIDVKIVDFDQSYLEENAGGSNCYFDGVGTGFYRAPEVMPKRTSDDLNESARQILEKLSDKADQNLDLNALKLTDVYSFGMVCCKVLTGEIPYSKLRISEYAKVWNGDLLKSWWHEVASDLHPGLKSLVGRCLCLDPAKRPTFEVICEELHKIF